jgi:hypothetical protein
MGVEARSFTPVVGLSALGRGLMDFGVSVNLGEGLEVAAMAVGDLPVDVV